jgi:hypothetical protein
MRRTELLTGVRQVQEAFEASDLIDMLDALLDPEESDPSELISSLLQSLNTYSVHAREYNAAALQITSIFGLDDLHDPTHWSQLVLSASAMGEEQRTHIQTLQSRALIVKHYLPKIAGLFEADAAHSTHQLEMQYGTKQLLTVVVIEEAKQFSSPERLRKMLGSIDTLYEVCATLEDTPHEKLSVVACDSGEDKSFDFVGAAPAIDRLKRLVLDLWNRIVFHRDEQLERRLEMVSHNLPILHEIREAEDEDRIGPEQAELLRRRVLDGATRFLESGAIIPEIERHTEHDPRRLMRPATKMLVSPTRPPASEAETLQDDEEMGAFLDDAERAELLRLFHRSRSESAEDNEAAAEPESADTNGARIEDEQLVAEAAQELSKEDDETTPGEDTEKDD